ncbi:hypothetical protein [Cellulomonas shaoxiangyii]|uniref:Uncharacterized protein n=1 Tax=Cellulomonas shaoxiangyii TaxID=2566013 RepID=A0A4P7SME3_9CELL|nr:hypothetical protein [Cellulomonas shaoxiangyii]QCB94737.1 hypothetical protein E5225_15410 [Cellulomonas shaoxiangyii]TGY86467.1 hypothetical protein E5226_01435 [Cellulomonas shaoxiangyii]
MVERTLTTAQKSALLFEAHAARQLLGHGCHLLAGSHGIEGKFDALATSWSIGVEKTLKVTLGLAALSRGEKWPNGQKFGHNLVHMNGRLLQHLDQWQKDVSQSSWLADLLAGVRDDPILPPLLVVLDTYARSGRFAYLDRLAEVGDPPDEPRPLWQDVEMAALTVRPDLKRLLYGGGDPLSPVAEFNAGLLEMNCTITRSLTSWWFTVTRVGLFNAYGAQSRQFTPELEPDMALPALPKTLLNF